MNEADQNTLVIFDCDQVLITPKDAIFHPNNSQIYKKVVSYLTDKIGRDARNDFFIDMRKQFLDKLVNKNLPSVIKNLQSKGIRVLLLTRHWTGKFSKVERVENLRKRELLHYDFDFKKSWRDCPNFTFYNLPSTVERYNLTSHPTFDDGIIFACEIEKGIVLKHFLKHIPMRFSRIIFVDDKMKNVRSVFETSQELKIPCTCIEYTKVKNSKARAVDFETERKRFDDFIKTKKWKSDSEDWKF